MIRFYRLMHPFYAMTLDLDNTLYDNNPIIAKAEDNLVLFLQRYHPALSKIEKKDYCIDRKLVRLMDPKIYHNVNHWRWKSLEKTLLRFGLSKHDAKLGADCGMEVIIYWRNKIDVPVETYKALSILSSRWPLIAITNGNADPVLCGLKKYFVDILRAGIHGRAKPYKDMYVLASKYFSVSCKHILHVGDDLRTDVAGAIQIGMQACWINKYYSDCKNNLVLVKKLWPHLEISELMALTHLL